MKRDVKKWNLFCVNDDHLFCSKNFLCFHRTLFLYETNRKIGKRVKNGLVYALQIPFKRKTVQENKVFDGSNKMIMQLREVTDVKAGARKI